MSGLTGSPTWSGMFDLPPEELPIYIQAQMQQNVLHAARAGHWTRREIIDVLGMLDLYRPYPTLSKLLPRET